MVVKVMQINSGQKFGGVSSMILNFYRNVDRSKIQFDFVAPKTTSFTSYKNEIEKMGGNIVELKTNGNFIHRKIQFFQRLIHLMKKRDYDVVHINSGSIFLNIQVSWLARYCGIKKIIAHSHNGGNDSKLLVFLTKLCKPLLEFGPTDYFACSNRAAEFMFTNKRIKNKAYTVINNGVDVQKFKFNKYDRDEYQKRLSITGKTVLLHVGRFVPAKNHKKLIEVFSEYHKLNPQSVLLLAGEGALENEIHDQVNLLGLKDNVIFLGLRKDVSQLMSASDAFMLPSIFEGLPVVGIEAQTSGLPCLFSDSITSEVSLNSIKNEFLNLKLSDKKWAETINRVITNCDIKSRECDYHTTIDRGYSLNDVGEKLQSIYLRTDEVF